MVSFYVALAASVSMLSIRGTAPAVVSLGKAYFFEPQVNDPGSLPLVFTIANKPAWASFDTTTGDLWGLPTSAYVGTYSNITITVCAGSQKAVLPPFAITVQGAPAPASGAVTLVWQPPTETTSGTVLTNLAGYYIYYGRAPGHLDHLIDITNPGITRYVVSGLQSAVWYFQMTAYDRNDMESPPTAIESVVMQ